MERELTIDRLSKSGDGLAQVEGRAVFVAGALPGEVVRARVSQVGKALRAELLEVVTASPARRTPMCPLAHRCGGCDWMHVDEATQLAQKQEIVTSALAHVGGIGRDAYQLLPTVQSPRAMGYRRRAVLHPVGKRLGFFGKGSRDRVEVSECPALTEKLHLLPGLLADAMGSALKELEEVRLLEAGGAIAISLHARGAPRQKHLEIAEQLVRSGLVAGAAVVPGGGQGAVESFGTVALAEDGLWVRPDGFAQANLEVNRLMVAAAVELLELEGSQRVLELYAGNGNFTFPLARRAGQVTAVESGPLASQLAQRAATALTVLNVRFVQGDAEAITAGLVREGRRFERLLLDPPRAGAQGVGGWASKFLVTRVVYVACDPVSLARDAGDLVAHGFRPGALQLFDLFPQTRHVEAVMSFWR